MKKLLITIPCIYNQYVLIETLESIVNLPDTEIILLDNGADSSVQATLLEYEEKYYNITVWKEPINTFVNPAWNNFMSYFLVSDEYSHILILNSDVILHPQFYEVMKLRLKVYPEDILIPVISTDKTIIKQSLDMRIGESQKVFEGTPGVAILLNKRQANLVSPIPLEIKVWYGDLWCFSILRELGYSTIIPYNLIVFHHQSESVKRLPDLQKILDADKFNWENIVEPKMKEKINKLKNK